MVFARSAPSTGASANARSQNLAAILGAVAHDEATGIELFERPGRRWFVYSMAKRKRGGEERHRSGMKPILVMHGRAELAASEKALFG